MSQGKGLIGIVDRWTRYAGLALLFLGGAAIVAPHMSGLALAFLIGLILLVAGGLLAMFGLSARQAGKGSMPLVIGAVTAIAGLILVVQPSAGLALMRPIIIIYLLISGVSHAALAVRLGSDEGRREVLVGAVVAIGAALVIWTGWPISGARVVGLMVGSSLAMSGLAVMRIHRAIESVGEKARLARAALSDIRSARDDRPDGP